MKLSTLFVSLESIRLFFWKKANVPSSVLKELICEVEGTAGYARHDARAKAKEWLIGNVSSMGQKDILLARTHFWYLLPAGWGL
jgi:hypothetical protein